MKRLWEKVVTVARSLTVQIFFLLLMILMIQSVMILRYANKKASEDTAEKVDQYMKTYSETLSMNFDRMIEEINRNTKIILGNELVQNAIRSRYEPGYNMSQAVADNELIQYIIFSFTALRDDTQMILADRDGEIFLKASGSYFGKDNNIFENQSLEDQKELLDSGEYAVIPACDSHFYDYGNEPVYMLVRSLKDIKDGKIIAYMATLFSEDNIDKMLSAAAAGIEGVQIYILDETQKILAGTEAFMTGKLLDRNHTGDFKESTCFSDATGWEIVLRIPGSYISKNFVSTWNSIFPLTLMMIVVCGLFWCLFIYLTIIQPMKKLSHSMKRVEAGDWTVRIHKRTFSSEIEKVYYGFDEMVNEIDRLTKKNLQEQIMFKDAQMEALRYQINPHFLFNTLQTIEAIAEVYDVPEIQTISKSMGDMFRYNIRGFETVILDEELKMIDSFMQIEKIRFGEEFTYEIDVDQEARSQKILKFILQPIVENCIQHGLEGTNKWIKINAFFEGQTLTIQIVNSGRKMDVCEMERINTMLEEASKTADITWISNGIGMLNVHRRLVTRFGAQYGVSIIYSDERGTCVQLTMPKNYGKAER